MTIKYGLAEYDRHTGIIAWNINLPMDGVQPGFLYEFFRSAGENEWELCGTFPAGMRMTRVVGSGELRESEDPSENVALVFKNIE
jgi:hypothetical protein